MVLNRLDANWSCVAIAAHAHANRDALLERARMGRSICTGRDGKVVWIPPEEIFAHYGLDANGRPPVSAEPPRS